MMQEDISISMILLLPQVVITRMMPESVGIIRILTAFVKRGVTRQVSCS